ncbi:MAG: tetratricopeptide repeat protein, partial [Acidobacteriota bacterium]
PGAAPSAPRRGRIAVLASVSLLLVPALLLFWWTRGPAPPSDLLVAVPAPRLEPDAPPAAHLLADALRLGLLRAAALDGVSTVSPEVVDPVAPAGSGALSSAEIARATAASEILAARLECAPLSCRIRLQRLDPRGLALWVEDFEVPVDEPHLASRAAVAALQRAYPGRAPDVVGERSGPTERDYRRFLELRRQFVAGPSAAELERIDDGVSRLLGRSAASVDLHLLAAHVKGRLFALGRDRGHHLQALQHAEQAMARDPHDARAASLSVTLLLEAGELEQARARLREFEASFPADPLVLAARAWLASLGGEVDLALDTFAELATRRPSFFNWFRLARFEIEHGRLESARSHLELALAAFPGHRRSRSLLAQLELMGGRVERAAQIYAELAAQQPRLPVLSNLGLAQLLLGRFAEAAESFGRAADLAPEHAGLRLNLADATLLTGRAEEARRHYRRTVELASGDPSSDGWQMRSIRAQALAHLGRRKEAVAAVQAVLRLAPDNPQAHYEAALVYTLAGDDISAAVQAEAALAAGLDRRWFRLPFFDGLAVDALRVGG